MHECVLPQSIFASTCFTTYKNQFFFYKELKLSLKLDTISKKEFIAIGIELFDNKTECSVTLQRVICNKKRFLFAQDKIYDGNTEYLNFKLILCCYGLTGSISVL